MPGGDIVQSVIEQFLSKLEVEGQLTPKLVEDMKRLAHEGRLSNQEAIEAALKEEPLADDQAKES
jgi:hypothetical protein